MAEKFFTVLLGETLDVMARLPQEEAEDGETLNSSQKRQYRLSAEAFRQKFRQAESAKDESYSEFAYNLGANMEEQLEEAKPFGEHDKAFDCFRLEQFSAD